eukprot:1121863-Alexandrium_andersonii.AAC.1
MCIRDSACPLPLTPRPRGPDLLWLDPRWRGRSESCRRVRSASGSCSHPCGPQCSQRVSAANLAVSAGWLAE